MAKPSPMTASGYRRALKRLDLTIVGAAPVFGVRRRQSQRFAHDHAEIPAPLRKLIRLAERYDVDAEELADL